MKNKFEQWLDTLDLANLNDLQPNEGMEMGWFSCKKEVLEILNRHCNSHNTLLDQSLMKAYEEINKEL